jgi:hypothetical protein
MNLTQSDIYSFLYTLLSICLSNTYALLTIDNFHLHNNVLLTQTFDQIATSPVHPMRLLGTMPTARRSGSMRDSVSNGE